MVEWWPAYLTWRAEFEAVMDARYYTIEWLDREVSAGRVEFLSSDKAAICFELRAYPAGARDVYGLIAAGDLNDIRQLLIPAAEEWGRKIGCTAAVIESRDGWTKALKKQGYAPFQTALRKELGDGAQ